MTTGSLLPDVISALAADGFEATLTADGVTFRGSVDVNGISVRLRLEFHDLEFSEPAYVFIENPAVLPRPVLPHLDEKNELCVVDRHRLVADRYHAAAQARGIVIRAREVIERGLTRHATGEIAEEFPQHWGGKGIGVEFGQYEGLTSMAVNAGGYIRLQRHSDGGGASGFAVNTDARLSFGQNQKRPDKLGEVLEWAAFWDDTLPKRVIDALGRLSADDPHCLIVAPNGSVGFTLSVSSRGQAQIKALSRPGGWQRILGTRFAKELPIIRDRGYRIDIEYILGRNGDGMAPLSGKTIVIVGCGSIGGFLARSLAQLGAGRGGGDLILIDDDRLANTNIGRHVLGAGSVGRFKVEACRNRILEDLPDANVSARPARAQSQRSLITRSNLTIDATGEQGMSEMLNAWMLEARANNSPFPDLLHVWIEGIGAAVQTFMSSDSGFGCLRCLKPTHTERGRFSALRDELADELRGGCGETPFTPYGPAAPMMAAAMAAQHTTDWAAGNSRPLLRTARLNWATTKEIKPTNPAASDRCPACKRT